MLIRRARILVSLLAVVVSSLAVVGASQARTTNVANLDDGTCGRNLQVGSDRTASATATPTFVLWGDGGLSRYDIFIDGTYIGAFNSDGWANVCITTTVPLANGPHVLTGNELQPHSTYTITPFNFSVDTVPPAQPSAPLISGYSDSGQLGDHVTMYRNVNFTGTSDPAVSIQLYNGVTVIGGAKADGSGRWSATTSTLADGNYVVTAAAFDSAGNKSPLSLSAPLTIDGTAPSGPITSPTAGATVAGTVNVGVNAADNVAVWKVDFKVDGVTKATVTGPPWSYAWNTTTAANGTHTLTAVTTDAAGGTATSSVGVNVQNGAATVPSAPRLASATPGNGSVALSWSTPSSDGGSPLTGYRVYRGTSSGGETLVATLTSLATSYTDASLLNGTTYYYQVAATSLVGESTRSNELTAAPVLPAAPPGTPTLATATGGNGSVGLAWSPPATDGGSAITGYKLYRSTTAGAETLLATLGPTTSYTDAALTNGVTYYYQVTAVNSAGESARSSEKSATPAAPASAPGAPTLSSATAATGSVVLAWSPPASDGGGAITGYRIYRSSSSGAEALLATVGAVTSYTDTAATGGTTYYYEVSAVNAYGESPKSNELSAAPAAAPGPPTLNTATAATSSVALGWSPPSSSGGSAITAYRVYRSTVSGGETLVATLGAVTSYTDGGLTPGVAYYYKVSAVNAAGESVPSNERSAVPTAAATVPGAPTLTTSTAGNATVALGWTAPSATGGSAVTGYRIYRSTSSGSETLYATVGNVTTWTDTGVTNGLAYYYKVSALNAVGEGALSNERRAAPVTVPGAPTLTTATGATNSVALAWSPPATSGGTAVTGYKLYRSTSAGTETFVTALGNVTAYTDTGLTAGATYYYKLTAVNAAGEGVLSNEKSATATGSSGSAPGAPTLLSATAGNNTLTIAWSPPSATGSAPITGYNVYRSMFVGGEKLLVSVGNVTSFTDTSVVNGISYYYEVTAVSAAGEGALSNEKWATPGAPAGAPTALALLQPPHAGA